ncbi:endogenous retrovirus group K member 18 Env polyprotein-like [Acinonyx jubatus]|uniref:Endogenous retrovirus group K member 18 Env polyprotein-like n=1 Tax=Acinonyx jubatus TaxID=32536 RepID=A0ABM3NDX0_ACIJB|nr:endogenous retrovirus group K member 18 Env polyprotein-like [Acinonyx jubatus]
MTTRIMVVQVKNLPLGPRGLEWEPCELTVFQCSKTDTRMSEEHCIPPGPLIWCLLRRWQQVEPEQGPETTRRKAKADRTASNSVLQLRACVPPPYYLIVGDGTITPVKEDRHQLYRLTCPACVLTNCLPVDGPSRSEMKVYLVLQPPYWMLPVNVTGPWYPNYGMQLALEISKRLCRTRRFLGLLIAGLIAAVTVIASATVSVISLHESAQTASHVNELAHNVSKVFATQERIDRKLEAQLEALQEALIYLGDQFAVLRTRLSIICHDAYKHICVTPLEYTNMTWGQVRRHLQGVWHDTNTSLDLLQLQEEINAIASSSLSFPDPGDLAGTILHQLNGFNPFNILQHSF